MVKIDFDKYNKLTNQYAGGQCLKGYVEIMLTFLEGKKGKILDIGCGTGEWTKVLSDMGLDAYGVDIDLSKLKSPSSKFKKGDMHKLPFDDEYFDYIFNSGVFEHALSPYIAMSEMYRVLKKDGIVLLIVPTEKNRRLIYLDQHISVFDRDGLINLFGKIGFKIKYFNIAEGIEGQHYLILVKKENEK
ncbi:MAG: class I SAM-dependent methyltransferase [Candidatus Heimdallarchaeaceae archaeon]